MKEAKILKCNCNHSGQDKLHGAGMRVCNHVITKGTTSAYRCTVCNRELNG